MEKYITDEKNGLKYELVGDYYFLAEDDEPEEHRSIGIWGCGCPVDTSAEGRSTDRGGSRDLPNKRLTRQAAFGYPNAMLAKTKTLQIFSLPRICGQTLYHIA